MRGEDGRSAHPNEPHTTDAYEAPSIVALRSPVICEACGKKVTLHTLRYRHICFPSVQRVRQAAADAQLAVNRRAEAVVEQEKSTRYERFFYAVSLGMAVSMAE